MKHMYELRVLFALVALLTVREVCLGQPDNRPANNLLIYVGIQRKAYLVQWKDGVVAVNPILTDLALDTLVANGAGKAFIKARHGERVVYYIIDVISNKRTPINTLSDKLIIPKSSNLTFAGDKLCYTLELDRKYEIRVVDIISGKSQVVFENDGPISPASWSNDGKSIAYYYGDADAMMTDNFMVGISLDTAQGWQHRQIAPPSKLGMRSPARRLSPMWAGMDSVIIYDARYKDDERGLQTYAVDIASGEIWRITGPAATPKRHPNNIDVLFVDRIANEVLVWRTETQKVEKIMQKENVFFPTLLPGGNYLAFSDANGKIYITSTDGRIANLAYDTKELLPFRDFQWVNP